VRQVADALISGAGLVAAYAFLEVHTGVTDWIMARIQFRAARDAFDAAKPVSAEAR